MRQSLTEFSMTQHAIRTFHLRLSCKMLSRPILLSLSHWVLRRTPTTHGVAIREHWSSAWWRRQIRCRPRLALRSPRWLALEALGMIRRRFSICLSERKLEIWSGFVYWWNSAQFGFDTNWCQSSNNSNNGEPF